MGNLVSQLVAGSGKSFIGFLKRESDGALFNYEDLEFIPNQKLHLTLDNESRSKFRIPYIEQSTGSYRFSLDCSSFSDGYYSIDSREIFSDSEFPTIDLASYKCHEGTIQYNNLDMSMDFAPRKAMFCYIRRVYDGSYYKSAGGFDSFDLLNDAEIVRSGFRIPFIETEPGKYLVSRSLHDFLDGVYTVSIYRLTPDGLELKAGIPLTIHILANKLERGVLYNKINLSHDTGANDALRYIAPNGEPIGGAIIAIYDANKFDLDNTENPVGVTTTHPDGRWVNPVLVDAGKPYYIVFSLQGKFGPDRITVSV
jgi:hypothetical protein